MTDQLIFENVSGLKPVPARLMLRSNALIREVNKARPKTGQQIRDYATKLKSEGFTEAAEYWLNELRFY